MSVTKLSMELRNLNFGPVIGGNFWKAQMEGMRHFWIGDTLFLPPRSYQGTDQFEYEDTAPVIKVHYTDGSVQTFGYIINHGQVDRTLTDRGIYNGFTFPEPGQSSTVELALTKAQSEIQKITLELVSCEYGHSNGGGGGFSRQPFRTLGSTSIDAKSLSECLSTSEHLIVRIKLGEIWDTSISECELDSRDLLKIDFVTRRSYSDAWREVPVHPHWRSELNRVVTTEPSHGRGWRIPIAAFDPKQQGEVIGINHAMDGCCSELQSQHYWAYTRYQEERKKTAESAAAAAPVAPVTFLAGQRADAERGTAAAASSSAAPTPPR
jgi:hypothetical protein